MAKRLIKFESDGCSKCVMAQNFLEANGVAPEKIDINNYSDLDFISKYVSMTLPVIVLLDENENLVQKSEGFNPPELEQLISQL